MNDPILLDTSTSSTMSSLTNPTYTSSHGSELNGESGPQNSDTYDKMPENSSGSSSSSSFEGSSNNVSGAHYDFMPSYEEQEEQRMASLEARVLDLENDMKLIVPKEGGKKRKSHRGRKTIKNKKRKTKRRKY